MLPDRSYACNGCCSCGVCEEICCDYGSVGDYIAEAFANFKDKFVMDTYYKETYEKKGLKSQADQFRDVVLNPALLIGAFIDGTAIKYSLNKMNSENVHTMRDYHVSDAICKFGTLSRSLAASEAKMNANIAAISALNFSRYMNSIGGIAESGLGLDTQNRAKAVVLKACNPFDNNNGLSFFCKPVDDPDIKPKNYNMDIGYTEAIENKSTLDLDFTKDGETDTEQMVALLGYNLYGHRQFMKGFEEQQAGEEGGLQNNALMHAVTARRNVAVNSFATIVAMKAAGSGGSDAYMLKSLQNLGLSSADATTYSGGGFSYFAQMDVLAKKLYQSPNFYANLMDSPANVRRITAAMEAIDLVQTRDIYTSSLRSETLMAVLLDLAATHESIPKIKNKYVTKY